jgi:putative transposase
MPIGLINWELSGHVIAFHDQSLRQHLRAFVDYDHRSRTHLGLQKDTPEARSIQAAEAGQISAIPEIGGLHHRYERHAAGTSRLN